MIGISNLLFAATWAWSSTELDKMLETGEEPTTFFEALEELGEDQGDWIFLILSDFAVFFTCLLFGLILIKLPKWIETRGNSQND